MFFQKNGGLPARSDGDLGFKVVCRGLFARDLADDEIRARGGTLATANADGSVGLISMVR